MKRPLAAAGCLYFAALMAALLFGESFAAAGVLFFAGLGLCSLCFSQMRKASVWAACFTCVTAMASGMLFDHFIRAPQQALAGHRVLVSGLVTETAEKGIYSYELTASFPEIEEAPSHVALTIISRTDLQVCPGQQLSCYVDLEAKVNGGRFDFYNLARGQFLTGYNPSNPIAAPGGFSIEKLLVLARGWIKNNLSTSLPPDAAALCSAVLLGDRSGLREEQIDALKISGIYHLTAVSGIHLSLLTLVISWLLSKSRQLSRRAATLLTMGFALFFMALTGFSMSICRAGWMMLVMLAGRLFYRQSDSVTSLIFAVWCIVVVTPYAIFDIGLQLSALSTFGVLWVNPQIDSYLKRFRWYAKNWGKAGRTVKNSLLISASVALVSAPVAAWYFGYIPVFSALTNLPMLFLAPAVLLGAFLTALIPNAFSWVLLPMKAVLITCCRLTLWFAGAVSALPFAVWPVEQIFPFFWMICGGAGLFLLIRKQAPASAVGAMLAVMLLGMSPIATNLAVKGLGYPDRNNDVQLVSIMQGQAELVISKGSAVVFQLPESISAMAKLSGYLNSRPDITLEEVYLPRGNAYSGLVIEFLKQHQPLCAVLYPEDADAENYMKKYLPHMEIRQLSLVNNETTAGICHGQFIRIEIDGSVLLKSVQDCDIITAKQSLYFHAQADSSTVSGQTHNDSILPCGHSIMDPDWDVYIGKDGTVYTHKPLQMGGRIQDGQFEALVLTMPDGG